MLNIGDIYNNLTVISFSHSNKQYAKFYECICTCGNLTIVNQSKLKSGHTTSCGCIRKTKLANGDIRRIHGETKSKLYKVWTQMKQRCNNTLDRGYHKYGAKGIKVCSEWQQYLPFKEWALSNGYTEGLSIDRKDGTKNYEPSNCRWVTSTIQAQNQKLSKRNTTGYKHISKRGMSYLFRLKGKEIKRFSDIESAINFRNDYYVKHGMFEYINVKEIYETK